MSSEDVAELIEIAESAADIKLPERTLPEVEPDASLVPIDHSNGYVEPWLRLPTETDTQWTYFQYFRDLGPTRSLEQVQRHFGLGPNSLYKYSGGNDWTDRARAFDKYQDRVYQATLMKEIREMASKHADAAAKNIEALLLPAQAVLRKLESNPDLIDELSEKETKQLLSLTVNAARTIPSLMNAERLSRGLPTEITHTKTEVEHIMRGPDLAQLADVVAGLFTAGALTGAFANALGSQASGEIIDAEVESLPGSQHADSEADRIPPAE